RVGIVCHRCADRAAAVNNVRDARLACVDLGDNGGASLNSKFLIVAVYGVGNQCVEWLSRLDVSMACDEQLDWRPPRAVELELMRTVVRQSSICVLQQSDKIE